MAPWCLQNVSTPNSDSEGLPSYLYRSTCLHSCTSGSSHIVLLFSHFCAFALSSAAQYLSNFSVLRITREIVEIHLPGPQSQRFCFGGLGEEPWDVLLNWPHHPFWCRWSIDFCFEKPSLQQCGWLGVAWNGGFTSEFGALKLSILKVRNLSKPIEE